MRRIYWLISLSLLVLASCSTSRDGQIYQNFDDDEIQVGVIEDSLFTLEIAYIGAIGHSYIFECAIDNMTENSLILDKSQFTMQVIDGIKSKPIDENNTIEQLVDNRQTLKKRKKSFTIFSGVMIGIGVLAGATEGLSAGEVLAYNADPLIAIFDERRWYQRNIESLEDEIEYIRSAQFHSYHLEPYETVIRDVLFPATRVNHDVDIIFTYGDQEFTITFPKKAFR